MGKNRYRVVKKLPWIEGGKPAPGFGWEGGRSVVYEPGDTVEVDDREVRSIYHMLEALDDAGREVLEAARAEAEKPARIVPVADLHPRAVDWISRSMDERQRAEGDYVTLCVRIIARGEDPTNEELAAALESPEAPPQELRDYVAQILRGKYRKSGREKPPRTTREELLINHYYHIKGDEMGARFRRNRQERGPVRRRAAEEVAEELGLGVRTVQRIVAPRPLTKTDKS